MSAKEAARQHHVITNVPIIISFSMLLAEFNTIVFDFALYESERLDTFH